MNRLTDVGIRAVLAKPRTSRVEMADGAVPGLTLRIGKTRGATWSLMIRVVGEGGITERGYALMGPKRRLTLGIYPQVSLHAARAKASAYLDQAKRGESPIEALERAATARLTIEGLAEKFLTDYVYLKQLRAARRYELAIRTCGEPGLPFSLHPGDAPRRELYAHREVALILQVIDLCFAQAGHRQDLRDSKHANRRGEPCIVRYCRWCRRGWSDGMPGERACLDLPSRGSGA